MKRSLTVFFFVSLLVWSPLLFAETNIETPNYGWLLVKTGFVLVGICLSAYVGLKYLSKVNVGAQGPMKILGRLPIDGRRSVVVIDVAGKTLIVGNSESGMETLGELDAIQRARFDQDSVQPKNAFKDLMARAKDQPVEEEA